MAEFKPIDLDHLILLISTQGGTIKRVLNRWISDEGRRSARRLSSDYNVSNVNSKVEGGKETITDFVVIVARISTRTRSTWHTDQISSACH